MEKMDDRLKIISSVILDEAGRDRDRIIEETNALRERELAACEQELANSMRQTIQRETRAVHQKTVREKAQAGLAARRELLSRRQELAGAVFAEARTRLLAYVDTPEYRAALLRELSACRQRWDPASSAVLLREADLSLAEEIAGVLPGALIRADESIRIGGFRLLNSAAGILLDETLDERLEAQRPLFYKGCGLKAVV